MQKYNKKVQILDCTLREGGYYNNWNFSIDLIENYLKSIKNAGIQIAEVGFRLLKADNLGICAHCSDDFLKNIAIPENLQIAVMIKADDFFCSGLSANETEKALNSLFSVSDESMINLVRIAVPYQKICLN